ncbi:MAG: hypothetical protein ACRD2W_09100 [Acidimicrobiales bacterium]
MTTGVAVAAAAAGVLVAGGMLLCAGPAGAVTLMTETHAGAVARPTLTAAQAVIILTAMMVTLAIWTVLLLMTKPFILRWLQVRRFRSQLGALDGGGPTW